MRRSLILSFNSAVAKYSRLSKKVRKSISRGEFWRLTLHQRNHLLQKIERLKRRISELNLQLKLAGAGIAAGLMMLSADATAQKGGPGPGFGSTTPIGPFVENPLKNPFPKPAFERVNNPVLSFWDMDNDGDLDVSLGSDATFMQYYRNVGTAAVPVYESYYNTGLDVYWFGDYGNPGRPAYADMDDDGDMDLLVGAGRTDYDNYTPDHLYFYRNTGTPEAPFFQSQDDDSSPIFDQVYFDTEGWPTFTDFDKDGDLDLIVTGRYFDPIADGDAWLQFFRNDKVGHDAGVNAQYTRLSGPDNPLYIPEEFASPYAITFVDLDGDGDEDFFTANRHGEITYKRNDDGTFVQQDGQYTYNGADPKASTGNPLAIDNLDVVGFNEYKSLSFADLDGDGDKDLIIGTNNQGTLNAPYIYVENTGHGVMVPDRSFNNRFSGFTMGGDAGVSFIDYDKDGDLDVLTTGSIEVPVGEVTKYSVGHVLFKNDNHVYTPLTLLGDPFNLVPVPDQGSMRVVDVDGDADLDVVMITYLYIPYGGHQIVKYVRNDNGTYVDIPDEENPLQFLSDGNYNSLALDFGDMDSDGLPDLIASEGFAPLHFYKNTGSKGNPAFTRQTSWETGILTELFPNGFPKVTDIDNDGDLDILVGKYRHLWYYNNKGTSTEPQWKEYFETDLTDPESVNNPFRDIGLSSGTPVPNLTDMDGDGDQDLLFGNDYEGYFTFFENQNPAPVVTPTKTTIAFVLNTALTLDAGLTLADPDNDIIVKVTAKITPYQAGQESLKLNGTFPNIVATWVDSTGVLILTGNGSIGDYQDAIHNIQYTFTGPASGREVSGNTKDRGKTIQKQVTLTALDTDLTIGPNTTVFTISGDDGSTIPVPGSAPVIDTQDKKAAAGGNVALSINQVATDVDGDIVLSTLVVTSAQGASVTIANGIVTVDYTSIPDFQGTDVITVTVCDAGGHCATSTFSVEVGAEAIIYTGMSPNGDGVNDWFTIQYLPRNTHVAIYNRWGDSVFETNNYDANEPSSRFEGKNKNGTEVVAGSYFYKVKFPDGSVKTGYILLNR